MKLSIVIPNYNGAKLLRKNLPKIIEAAKNAEIIVVDDASSDNSRSIVREFSDKIILIKKDVNQGFARACNDGVKRATGEIVVLLNNDVTPEKNFLSFLKTHFKDPLVFSVGSAEITGETTRGKAVGEFKRGFLVHSEAKNSKPGFTLWSFGASAAYDKKKWNQLGGMDSMFRPAYWEDIDICWRAWKKGWKVMFEPMSRVHHDPESTNLNVFGRARMKTMSYKNQILFVWKNIEDLKLLLAHLVWLPIHIISSLFTGDGAFLHGLFNAVVQLPEALHKRNLHTSKTKNTDSQILEMFKKI